MRAVKNSYWKQEWKNVRRYKDLLALFTIVIAYFVIFKYIPMYGVTLAFKDFRLKLGILRSPWAGLKHFRLLFSTPSFFEVLRNTVSISLLRIVFGFPAPILLALLLNELRDGPFKKTVQTVSYLPHFLSWVVLGGIFTRFLSPSTGFVNMLIKSLGGEPIFFLGNPNTYVPTIIVTDIWQGIGWGSIVYLAAISGISPELYESAMLDGASRWQIFFKVMMPVAKPGLAVVLMQTFLTAWNELQMVKTFITDPLRQPLSVVPIRFAQTSVASHDFTTEVLYAALVICLIPVVVFYAFAARSLVAGLTSGAVKG